MRAMKDSGIEWIGQIPREWSYSKIKYHCSMKSGDNITSLNIEETSHYPVYGGNGQRGYFPRYNVDGNKILIGRQGALAGNVHYVSGKFWATDHAIVTTPFKDINILYFYYLLKGYELNRYAQDTAAQPGLAVSKIMNLAIYLPSFIEQQQIADFLDTQCSEIDATAEDIQKEISLLEDYKKSVITEAVTKGLNPDVEMKDSGIEWIGQIPKHWITIRIGYILSEIDRRSITGTEESLSVSQVLGVVPSSQITVPSTASTMVGQKIVEPGELVLNKLKAHLGVCFVSNYKGLVSPDYAVYKANEKVNSKLLEYVFHTASCIWEFKKYITGVGQGLSRLYSKDLFRINIALPDISEQQQIADYLDAKCSEIDALIADKKKQLAILAEYKKSLIYEYVTGKKEVPAEKF